MQLWSSDNAALILARTILRREPKVLLQIFLGGTCPEGAISVPNLWKTAIIAATKKYRRLGVVVDSDRDEELQFFQKSCATLFPLQYELLGSFANRGLADTVEFRRLARKYLRPAKNAHCDGVLFLSGILAEESSQKILEKMLGTQIKPVFITEFLPEECFIPAKKQQIEIFTDQDLEKIHQEAEKFLHTKLAKGAVVSA